MEQNDSFLAEITAIEEAAVAIDQHFGEEKLRLASEYEQMTKTFDEEADRVTDDRLDELRRNLREEGDLELEKMRKNTRDLLASLDEEYEHEHAEITARIIEHMITGA